MTVLVDVGRALREAFFMFWETLWPLVLGFGLSGAVQAFTSRRQMERLLGDRRPATIARAGALGMASSSCSYAASAMAKTLFQKGADFVAAMVFMVASTNLVLELGIVLVVLLGWQFAAAEFVVGPIMILLFVALAGLVLRRDLLVAARRRLQGARTPGASDAGHHEDDAQPAPPRLRSVAGWADAARYTLADLTMLRRELVVGYLVAGFLAVLVPAGAWHALFLRGHGG
ncbi:MAG: permease, partial [Gemmatimonadales bacterium]